MEIWNDKPNTHYIFMYDKYRDGVRGSATRPNELTMSQPIYVNIYRNSGYPTYVHEIGHNHTLKHTFELNNPLQDAITNNFMDYSLKRNNFWRWQIKK